MNKEKDLITTNNHKTASLDLKEDYLHSFILKCCIDLIDYDLPEGKTASILFSHLYDSYVKSLDSATDKKLCLYAKNLFSKRFKEIVQAHYSNRGMRTERTDKRERFFVLYSLNRINLDEKVIAKITNIKTPDKSFYGFKADPLQNFNENLNFQPI